MKQFLLHPATIATVVTTAVVGPSAYFYGKSVGKKQATKADESSNTGSTGNSTKTGTNG